MVPKERLSTRCRRLQRRNQTRKTHANLVVPIAGATSQSNLAPSFVHVPPRLVSGLETEAVHARGIRCRYQSQGHAGGRSCMNRTERVLQNRERHMNLKTD